MAQDKFLFLLLKEKPLKEQFPPAEAVDVVSGTASLELS